MKKMLKLLAFVSIAIAIGGCSSSPVVAPVESTRSQFEGATFSGQTTRLGKPLPDHETYQIFRQAATGFISVATVRANVEEAVTKHCERLGKAYHPLQETASKPPHILGNFPKVEWTFQCVDKPSGSGMQADRISQIERLKRLLDSGAITQAEYNREKEKLLGAQ